MTSGAELVQFGVLGRSATADRIPVVKLKDSDT
jgi:hypothetical protein